MSLIQPPDQPIFIDAPRDPNLAELFAYWCQKRGTRPAPAREDIRPDEIAHLLPDVMIWNVDKPGGPYTIRRVGENIVRFVGRNNTGAAATEGMPQHAAAVMIEVLTRVAQTMTPLFRAGQAFWHPGRAHRDFEACYLPLSADGIAANLILGGVTFASDEAARVVR